MNKGLLLAALVTWSFAAQAQTSTTTLSTTTSASSSEVVNQESTMKVDSVLKNKKFEDDKDITDSRLKADSGSLSRYSLKFSLSYYGPPIGDLSNKKQPNPDGSIGNNDTSLSGSISGRYRLDSKSAISMGTGVSALTPFHGSERTDVKTPFVNYDRNTRLGNVQMRNSYGVSVTTVQEYIDVGQYATLSYDNSLVYNLGASGFAVGMDASLSYFLYNRDYQAKDRTAGRYYLGWYPQVKYNVTDKFNMYTSVAVGFTNPRAREDQFAMLNRTTSQRLGAGYAFTRDIYLSTFLNFYPKDLRTESTTVSFSTVFSIL